jgi:putative ABC transport system permease protein
MGLALTLARRSLLRHKGRTLFSVLGVALGIATVVCVFTLDHVTLLSRTWVDPSWRADLELRALDDVADPRATLASTPGVADVAAFFQNEARVRRASDEAGDARADKATSLHVVALDAGSGEALGAYRVSAGRDLAALAERPEALVGAAFAAEHGLALGDELFVSKPRRAARSACINGKLKEIQERSRASAETAFTVVGLIADEGIGARSAGRVLVIDYEAGRGVFQGAFVEPRFWIKRDPAVDLEDLGADLGQSFSYELNKSRAIGQMEDERAFRNGVRMVGLFALILGLYVIFHTLSMSLVERLREVAVLHALGTSRGQIARVFFVEALAIALAAGVGGVALGLGLARALLGRGITTLGVVEKPIELLAVPWRMVGWLAFVGVGIALLGSVYPLLRAQRTDTVSALAGDGPAQASGVVRGFQIFAALLLVVALPALYFLVVPVVGAVEAPVVGALLAALAAAALLIGLPLVVPALVSSIAARLARLFAGPWPFAGRMAARSIESGPTRVCASVAAIALVTAAFVGLKGMTNSLAAEIETWGATAVADKVFVTNLPDVSIAEAEVALHALAEVRAVESGDARTYVPFLLLGLEPDELARFGLCQRDPEVLRQLQEEQGMLISSRLARHRKLAPGDRVAIPTSGHGVQAFTVAGVSDDYGYFTRPDERIYGVVDAELLRRFFCLDTKTTGSLAVTLEAGSDPTEWRGAVQAALQTILPPDCDPTRLRFETGTDLLAFQLADIRRDFVLFDILFGLTALLAALGVLNGQLLAALQRSQELGVLRALGTSQRQLAGMVLSESLVLGAIGGLLGLAVGSAMTPLVVRALELVSGLPLPQRTAGPALAACFAGALLLTLLAGLYPIWRISRLDPVRAVRSG